MGCHDQASGKTWGCSPCGADVTWGCSPCGADVVEYLPPMAASNPGMREPAGRPPRTPLARWPVPVRAWQAATGEPPAAQRSPPRHVVPFNGLEQGRWDVPRSLRRRTEQVRCSLYGRWPGRTHRPESMQQGPGQRARANLSHGAGPDAARRRSPDGGMVSDCRHEPLVMAATPVRRAVNVDYHWHDHGSAVIGSHRMAAFFSLASPSHLSTHS